MNLPSRRAFGLGAVALVFLAGFGWVFTTQGPLAPIKVTVARLKPATLRQSIFGIATVEARRAYSIGPTLAGRLAAVHVDQGDVVSAGQVLAEMDPVDLDARQTASRATAAKAAELVTAARASLTEASSRAQLAANTAQRYMQLRQRNFVSQEAAAAKTYEAAAARAGAEAAQASVAAATDELHRAQAEQEGLAKSRAHLRLSSPVAGVISARLAEPGSTVVAGQAVLQIVDPAQLWLRLRIDQGQSRGLAEGLAADIVLRSHPGKTLHGKVERLDLVGDAVTEERIANVSFEAPPEQLALGEIAEVRLHLPALENVMAIPATALKRINQVDGVWRVQSGRAEFVAVHGGASSSDGLVQIVDGLDQDAEVIVHSQRAITTQARVKVVDSLQKAAP